MIVLSLDLREVNRHSQSIGTRYTKIIIFSILTFMATTLEIKTTNLQLKTKLRDFLIHTCMLISGPSNKTYKKGIEK